MATVRGVEKITLCQIQHISASRRQTVPCGLSQIYFYRKKARSRRFYGQRSRTVCSKVCHIPAASELKSSPTDGNKFHADSGVTLIVTPTDTFVFRVGHENHECARSERRNAVLSWNECRAKIGEWKGKAIKWASLSLESCVTRSCLSDLQFHSHASGFICKKNQRKTRKRIMANSKQIFCFFNSLTLSLGCNCDRFAQY